MTQHSSNEKIMCHFFSTSLKPTLLEWYHNIPYKIYRQHDTLEQLLVTNYIHNKRKKFTLEYVSNLQFTEVEMVKAFLDRLESTI